MTSVRTRRIALAAASVVAVVVGGLLAAERSASSMTSAATALLASLTPEQREQAQLPFASDDRLRWNFIPTDMFPRKGLALKAMSEAQRARARDLLKTGLSQRGYLTATAIMDLESTLGAVERAARDGGRRAESFRRDPLEY